MKAFSKNLLFAATLAAILVSLAAWLNQWERGIDFSEFYAAAKMVSEGHGAEIYSAELQREYQARFFGRTGTYFNHPPFEALFFLPVSAATPTRAFYWWGAANVFLLGWVMRILQRTLFPHADWRILLLAALSFPPILLNFLQGQDAVLLLACTVLAFAAWKEDQPALCGIWLGCGLFKFHLTLPLAAVIFFGVARRCRFLYSLLSVALMEAIASSLISGWKWPLHYFDFLRVLPSLPLAGIHPEAMANLRALTTLAFPAEGLRQTAVLAILSAALLLLTIRSWKWAKDVPSFRRDLVFAQGVVVSLLVGYHLSPHDVSLLLLPLIIAVHQMREDPEKRKWIRYIWWLTLTILFLPPFHLLLIKEGSYYFLSLPLFLFLFALHARVEDWWSHGDRLQEGLSVRHPKA
jgi:hypothetical protein